MAVVNTNNAHMVFNGTTLNAYWIGEVDKSEENSTVETTSGAGVTHVMRNPGLSDNTISFAVVVDDTDFAAYKAALVLGTKGTLTYGPEGAVSGKPKFECVMILKSVSGANATIAKDTHMYELEFEGAAAPTSTLTVSVF
jgi:hypothetical protein